MLETSLPMRLLSFIFGSPEFRTRLEASRPRLYRLAYSWCRDVALAEDLVQETLYKALRKSDQLCDINVLEGWLFRILANCWHDHLRQSRNTIDIDDIEGMEDMSFTHRPTPEDIQGEKQLVTFVRNAIERLSLGQREALTLVDLEEFSYSETAAILNIPVGTVMSRVCRARQALKQQLFEQTTLSLVKTKFGSME